MTEEEKYDRAGRIEERRAELDIKGSATRQAIVKAVNDAIPNPLLKQSLADILGEALKKACD